MQSSYLRAQSQNELIELLGQHIQQTIIAHLNDSSFYSVMMDSTPDISNREIYTIVVRLTNNFNVEEGFISAVESPNKTGLDISNVFFSKIE